MPNLELSFADECRSAIATNLALHQFQVAAPRSYFWSASAADIHMPFIRHCVECPKCSTYYLIGFSPYANGSWLVRVSVGLWEEYILYCSCRTPSVSTRWREEQVKTYAVSKTAHRRGYGSGLEIVQVHKPK